MSLTPDIVDESLATAVSDISSSETELTTILNDDELQKSVETDRLFQSVNLRENLGSGDRPTQDLETRKAENLIGDKQLSSGDAPINLDRITSKSSSSSGDTMQSSFIGEQTFENIELNRNVSQDSSIMNRPNKIMNPKVVVIGFVGLIVVIIMIVLITLI